MIRWDIDYPELERRIEIQDNDWFLRVGERLKQLMQRQEFDETNLAPEYFWTNIKPVFKRLQYFKCAYCERALPRENPGRIAHDLEHYRPKGEVKPWPSAYLQKKYGISFPFPTGVALKNGYYLLAYQYQNFLIACRSCNLFKNYYFPIEGDREKTAHEDITAYQQERPFLPYPIGPHDQKPEDLITFEGIRPVPKTQNIREQRRALVTIRLLQLDTRETLLRERAMAIRGLWFILTSPDTAAAEAALQTQLAVGEPHSNCIHAFYDCYNADPNKARRHYFDAVAYLKAHP